MSRGAGGFARHTEARQRRLRVGEAVRHALAEVLVRGKLRDPALAGVSITVSEVRMSPDLRRAAVYVTRLGGGETAAVLAGLRRAAPYLRAEVAKRVPLRFTPELVFEADTSFDRAAEIARLLRDAGQAGEGEHE